MAPVGKLNIQTRLLHLQGVCACVQFRDQIMRETNIEKENNATDREVSRFICLIRVTVQPLPDQTNICQTITFTVQCSRYRGFNSWRAKQLPLHFRHYWNAVCNYALFIHSYVLHKQNILSKSEVTDIAMCCFIPEHIATSLYITLT